MKYGAPFKALSSGRSLRLTPHIFASYQLPLRVNGFRNSGATSWRPSMVGDSPFVDVKTGDCFAAADFAANCEGFHF